jgi:hypothetical protein
MAVSSGLPVLLRRLVLPLALMAMAFPGALQGQEVPAPDRERLEVYARAFTDIAEVRERIYAELARTHDPEGKERVREELDREVEEVLEAHGMASEEFQEITFLVSADAAYQEAFQAALAALADGAPR